MVECRVGAAEEQQVVSSGAGEVGGRWWEVDG